MKYPTVPVPSTGREMVDIFKGYNHNLRIGEGEFFDMINLTSDHYPVLSPRGNRGIYASPASPQGLIAKDALCYVDGSEFVMNEYRVDMGLSEEPEDCPKQLISMGAYVIILPDRKWINTLDITDFGDIDASVETNTDVTFELCTVDGEAYDSTTISPEEPVDPENGDHWIDTSAVPHSLKQYSSASGMWISIAATYIRISASGIGKAFSQYDGVSISGVLHESLQNLNAATVIWAKDDDYIVVPGIIDAVITQQAGEGSVKVERKMPVMDFVTEANNRLWGCRYGVAANGEVVNELYACKLGDFKNWNCFMGIATDSWAASVGTDGQWTGAATLSGFPVFFKENCLHKIYISASGAHQVQDTACRGVQKGCHKSLAIVNETLLYKAVSGICAYDGSLPSEVSQDLGNGAFSEAVGGTHGNKYYVSMKDATENWHLFVYDAGRGMWHREDSLHAGAFCSCGGEMYCIDRNTNKIITIMGSGVRDTEPVTWMAQTGQIGLAYPDMKYISRLTIRMSMDPGTEVKILARYDTDGQWVTVGHLKGTSLRSFAVPVRPRRCDHMVLRFEGAGGAKIYSITKTIEQGSDVS